MWDGRSDTHKVGRLGAWGNFNYFFLPSPLGADLPPPPPEGALGLARFEVVLPDADAVSAAAERLSGVGPIELVEEGVLAVDPSGNAVLGRT